MVHDSTLTAYNLDAPIFLHLSPGDIPNQETLRRVGQGKWTRSSGMMEYDCRPGTGDEPRTHPR